MAVISNTTTIIDAGAISVSKGALTLITTLTANNSATLTFASGINSTYDKYLFKFIDIHPTHESSFSVNFRDGSTAYDAPLQTAYLKNRHTASGTELASQTYDTGNDLANATGFTILNESTGNDDTKNISGSLHIFNPSSMKDDSAKDRGIDVSNIFNIDRMNLGNSFEAGKSLTFGVDFRKENLLDINNYFSLKLGTVIRDTEEDKIPKSTTLNRKNSNLFGSIEKGLGENINLEYNFSLDNDYRTLEYNGITSNFNFDNFDSTFTYSEENGERGDASVWSNETSFNIDEKHYFTFGTRRNRKLSLTEYYDLVYDYRNDCLKAGFKYKKTYYDDRDIKPKEDLLLTITFSPLTTYEHKVNQDFYRN